MFHAQVFPGERGKLGHYSKHTHSVSHLLELHYLYKIFQFLWIFFSLRKAILAEKPSTSCAQVWEHFQPMK